MREYFKDQKILANCGDMDSPNWIPGQIIEIDSNNKWRPYLVRLEKPFKERSEWYFPISGIKLDNHFNRKKEGIPNPSYDKEYRCETCGETFIRRRFIKVQLCLKCLSKRKRKQKPPNESRRKSRERAEQIYAKWKEGKGNINQNQLAREAGISRQAVSLIIIKMKNKEKDQKGSKKSVK